VMARTSFKRSISVPFRCLSLKTRGLTDYYARKKKTVRFFLCANLCGRRGSYQRTDVGCLTPTTAATLQRPLNKRGLNATCHA
jgi:hypothetical protein